MLRQVAEVWLQAPAPAPLPSVNHGGFHAAVALSGCGAENELRMALARGHSRDCGEIGGEPLAAESVNKDSTKASSWVATSAAFLRLVVELTRRRGQMQLLLANAASEGAADVAATSVEVVESSDSEDPSLPASQVTSGKFEKRRASSHSESGTGDTDLPRGVNPGSHSFGITNEGFRRLSPIFLQDCFLEWHVGVEISRPKTSCALDVLLKICMPPGIFSSGGRYLSFENAVQSTLLGNNLHSVRRGIL